MTETRTATLDPLMPAHLDGAVALSRAEGWPHRLEDWALILGLSRGIAAFDGDRLVGTAMATPFGPAATAQHDRSSSATGAAAASAAR